MQVFQHVQSLTGAQSTPELPKCNSSDPLLTVMWLYPLHTDNIPHTVHGLWRTGWGAGRNYMYLSVKYYPEKLIQKEEKCLQAPL